MDQQITVSSKIVNFMRDNLPSYKSNDVITLIELMEQNLFVSDDSMVHFNTIVEEIEKIADPIKKNEIAKIISNWINEKKVFINYKYMRHEDDEINLALNSIDKIYLNPSLDRKKIKKLKKNNNYLESHNCESFLTPHPIDRLKHLPTSIPLDKDQYYDLNNILSPFLRSTTNVYIIDPYLPNKLSQYNLFNLFDILKDKTITLVILSKSNYSKISNGSFSDQREKQYSQFLSEIDKYTVKGYSIRVENFKKKKHKERWIFTDDIQIHLPGGLDFLTKEGYLAKDLDKFDKKKIIIEKKEFDV